jgi:hypothetical protein
VGNGGAKQRHNTVAEHLVHRALIPVHGRHHMAVVLIARQLFGVDQLFLHVVEIGVAECEASLKRPVGDVLLAL